MNAIIQQKANRVPHVDFENYMKARAVDVANVKTADQFRAEVVALLKRKMNKLAQLCRGRKHSKIFVFVAVS